MSDETPQPEPMRPAAEPVQPPAPAVQALGAPYAEPPDSAPGGWWMPPAPPPVAPPPSNSFLHRLAAGIVVAAVVAAAAGAGIGWSLARGWATKSPAQASAQTKPQSEQTQPQGPIQPAGPGSGPTLNADAIAAQLDPAIVDINTVVGSGQAAGTGTIISSTGEVLTNNHVIDGSTSIQVTVFGHAGTYTAHLVASDPSADVAVIQLDGAVFGLPTVSFASSSAVAVGDSVVALGNALGRGGVPAVSQGSVTALDQTITASEGGSRSEQLSGMIQSDATIYPGDSGGPLVNTAGLVVGMITAGQSQGGFRNSSSNLNYSIPSDTLLSVVNQIRSGQTSTDIHYGQSGYIGVSVEDLNAENAAALGLNVSSGALVRGVQPGTAAERAGITANSVITAVDGSQISSLADLDAAVRSHNPGDRVSITWVTSSGAHTATLTLGGINR